MELRFVRSESTFSYFEALERYLTTHGRPVAFYSDKHTVFRVPKPSEHMTGMTQFGRALAELQIEILCANTSQAKGRVERANRTLQDRLVKELRIAGISDMKAANAFLPRFMERYNDRFAKPAARPDNLHRALNVAPDRLSGEQYGQYQSGEPEKRSRIVGTFHPPTLVFHSGPTHLLLVPFLASFSSRSSL